MEFAGPGSERHLHHSRHKDVTQLIPAADSARKKLRLDNDWLNNPLRIVHRGSLLSPELLAFLKSHLSARIPKHCSREIIFTGMRISGHATLSRRLGERQIYPLSTRSAKPILFWPISHAV